MLGWFHRIHGLRYASLRYFNVAGAPEGPAGVTRGEAHEPESHLIPLILDVALGRRQSIRSTATTTRLPTAPASATTSTSPTSLMPMCWPSGHSKPKRRQRALIYNLGNGQGFSVREVIESARRVTGHPIPAEIHPRRPGDPAVLVASSEKAIRELGWKPRYTQLDDIIRTAWVWHQKRYRK